MMDANLDRSPIDPQKAARPLERKLTWFCIVFVSGVSVVLLARDVVGGVQNLGLSCLLTVCSVIICLTTWLASKNQDESYRPWWYFLTYALIVGAGGFIPFTAAWASQQGISHDPALIPGFSFFVCLLAPLAVSNQLSFGLGSLVPKCVVISAVMHFTDNTDWGIYSANHLVSPQTAIGALSLFSALVSALFTTIKGQYSTWLMIGLGLLLTLPCILQIEWPLVVFHVL